MIKDLCDYSTKEIIEELEKREGVEKIIVEPYNKKDIVSYGPAIILNVID